MDNRTTIVIGAVLLTLLIGGAAIATCSNTSNQATMACDDAADTFFFAPVGDAMKVATVEALSVADLEIMIDDLESAKALAADASNALAQLMPAGCGCEVCKECGNLIKNKAMYRHSVNSFSMEKDGFAYLDKIDGKYANNLFSSHAVGSQALYLTMASPDHCPVCGSYIAYFGK